MLARRAESAAGCADDIGLFKKMIKKLPTGHILRCAEPDVRRVDTAGDLIAEGFQAVADIVGVFHVVPDHVRDLLLSFRRIAGLACALDDIGSTVILCTVPPRPEGMEGLSVFVLEIPGDDRGAQPQPGKSRVFGKRAHLDGAGPGPLALIDRMGDPFF